MQQKFWLYKRTVNSVLAVEESNSFLKKTNNYVFLNFVYTPWCLSNKNKDISCQKLVYAYQ